MHGKVVLLDYEPWMERFVPEPELRDEDEPDDDELSAAFEFGGIKRPESKTYDKLVRLTLS